MLAATLLNKAVEEARKYLGEKEITPNRSLRIDEIQKLFKLLGQQYCVMFVLYCYHKVASPFYKRLPFPLTASSQTLFEWALKNGFTYTDPKRVKPGDIAIWRKFKLWQGHAGLVVSYYDEKNEGIFTIEGNTSNGMKGSQRDGDGIWKRLRLTRKLEFQYDNFYLRGFIDMKKVLERGILSDV